MVRHSDSSSDSLVARAARLGDQSLDWNELDFVGWSEFRRMAPTLIGLETDRIERLIVDTEVGSDFYNALVRVRFALRQFVQAIERAGDDSSTLPGELVGTALIGLSLAVKIGGAKNAETLRYVAHRLSYLHDRIKLIY